ncbi:DUF5641 domain-containing protein [Trichonephila clavipes]|nr:DUF5641 domain-containing protein [Trichonephila clavipes]
MTDKLDNRLSQWQKLIKCVQFIWRKWRLDYLNNLQARHKWQFEKENVIPNSMVILKDENLPPCKRTMGRILEIVKSSDGKVRVVKVKIPQGIGSDEYPIEYDCRLRTHAEFHNSRCCMDLETFRGCLEGAEITVASNRHPLRWLPKLKSPNG